MTEYRTLNPKSMKSMRIGYLLMTAVLAIAAVVLFLARDYWSDGVTAAIICAALAAVVLVISMVFPRIYFDHYRYYISEDRVDVRSGIFFIRHVVVPIERIHQVEVVSGPVNRMFGLADVNVTTAGGTSDIRYLDLDEAERIADELNAIVDSIVRGQRQ